MEAKELFARGAQWASDKIEAIGADELHRDTPCTEWDVKAVANHVTSGLNMIGRAARSEEPDAEAFTRDYVGDDPASAFASELSSTLRELKDVSTDGTWKLPFGEMPVQTALGIFGVDQIAHGWDIAKATGQDATIPDGLATAALGVVDGNITEDRRGPDKFFGEQVEVPDDATPGEKLMGYLGRKP